MKTTIKKPSQRQRLLKYLRSHKRGITTYEAFEKLKITNLHKRIGELDGTTTLVLGRDGWHSMQDIAITRTPEVINGARIIRYRLA